MGESGRRRHAVLRAAARGTSLLDAAARVAPARHLRARDGGARSGRQREVFRDLAQPRQWLRRLRD